MSRNSLFQLIRQQASRFLTSQSVPRVTHGEQHLANILKKKFPNATEVSVQDISGGCGAMYEVVVESKDFQGKSRVQQHRMVNEALKEEIKEMHGLRIATGIPP